MNRLQALRPSIVPWRRPRRELLLLVLVALAALPVVQHIEAEDSTRMCLSIAVSHGNLSNDGCFTTAGEAVSGGHDYANVAPGVSALAVPIENLVGLPPPARWAGNASLRLWTVRVTVVGIAFLICAFLLGRVAEGIAPGWGGATLVTFALGTIASAVAPSIFDLLPAAALAFGAFLLAWAKRPLGAGLMAGLALTIEYQTAVIAIVLGAYVLLLGGRALGRYGLGLVPGAVLIGAYDWAAFGSPFRTSYSQSPTQPKTGLVGVRLPSLHGMHLVLVGDRGLLVDSPVLVAAAVGLVLLRRRAPAEAILCAVVAIAFVLLDCSYALPYGGDSPGPRFVVTALPFAAVGLAPAFARFPWPTAALAALSLVASTAVALTWPAGVNSAHGYGDTVWRYLGEFVREGSHSAIASWIQPSIYGHLGVGMLGAAGLVSAFAALAFGLALREGVHAEPAHGGR